MHLGGVRLSRAMLIGIATAGICTWGFCVSAVSPSELLISKVQITGGVGKTSEDIVSIYNASNQAVDLNGLRLVKRTKTGTSDTTLKSWVSPTLVNPGAYYTWANSSNGFSESIQADCSSTQTISDDNGVALREGAENSGVIIDSLGWGEASNMFVENAPFPTNHSGGQYIQRKNNLDTNNNSLDFELYPPTEVVNEDNPVSIKAGDIVINELVSDPESGDEWVELYNTTSSAIDLSTLTLEDGSGTKTTLSGAIGTDINAWFVITKPKGALNNSGDTLILKHGDTSINQVSYGDWDDGNTDDNAPAAEQPYSLARIIDGESSGTDSADFKVTTTPTKGLANIISTPETSDPEEETSTSSGYDYSKEIIISEIFPNPKGIDSEARDSEFIELYNKGTKPVFLSGWRFELNGLSFPLPEGTSLAGKSYLSFSTKQLLPLPNDGATIKLIQPTRLTSYQSVSYKEAQEGQSFANLIAGGWQWTSKPTPGVANISAQAPQAQFELLDEPELATPLRFDSSDSFTADKAASYVWDFGDDQTNSLANPTHLFATSGKFKVSLTVSNEYGTSTNTQTITIPKKVVEKKVVEKNETEDVATKEGPAEKPKDNAEITTAAIAVSSPGTHGTQYFYVLPEFGEPLYQIYNSKKLFPTIHIGDQLIVSGEYEERPEGPRLKTKDKADIKVIGKDKIEKPIVSLSTSLTKPPYPRLVVVSGEIVSKKWPRVILADDSGEIEIYMSSGTKLKTADFIIGDHISVFGILTIIDGKVRLQPRDKNDIEKIEEPAFQASIIEPISSQIPTAVTAPNVSSRKKTWFIYAIGGAVVLLACIGYIIQKNK